MGRWVKWFGGRIPEGPGPSWPDHRSRGQHGDHVLIPKYADKPAAAPPGGLRALNEIATAAGVGMVLEERAFPIPGPVEADGRSHSVRRQDPISPHPPHLAHYVPRGIPAHHRAEPAGAVPGADGGEHRLRRRVRHGHHHGPGTGPDHVASGRGSVAGAPGTTLANRPRDRFGPVAGQVLLR